MDLNPSPRKSDKHTNLNQRQCDICKDPKVDARGFARHRAACLAEQERLRKFDERKANRKAKAAEKKTKGKRPAQPMTPRTPKRPRNMASGSPGDPPIPGPSFRAATPPDLASGSLTAAAPTAMVAAPEMIDDIFTVQPPSLPPLDQMPATDGQNDFTTPSDAPGSAPSNASGSAPSNAPGSTPSNAPGSAPSNAPGSAPSNAPGSAPSNASGSAPSNAPGSAPSNAPGSAPSNAPGPTSSLQGLVDDIQVEFHPQSQRGTQVFHFEDYVGERTKSAYSPFDQHLPPWHPFDSRLDFEFAELTHSAHMNQRQIDQLLKLIKKISEGESAFTFQSSSDVKFAWEKAKVAHTSFTMSPVSDVYDNEKREFEFHHRPLWPWLVSQVRDPKLAEHFHWDAQRLSKRNNDGTFTRFYEEPWTAEKFWEVQTNIASEGSEAKPLSIILWSDKTKLSSHGSQKGHPIVARIGNLPADMRNGRGLGAGRVVGFVPIVEGTTAEQKKTSFVNFKNAIFHKSFEELLKEVKLYSHIGYRIQCGDGVWRKLFPFIHIVSADYEEQAYITLIRGLNGLRPCPVCLVPKEVLSDLTSEYSDRSSDHARSLVKQHYRTLGEKEEALKEFSLRPVVNAFWGIRNTEIYLAVCFDKLHAYHRGLWADHIWKILKKIIQDELGRQAEVAIDERIAAMPSWRGLTHFESATAIDFTDGEKWSDLAKIIIYAAFNTLKPGTSRKGYILLKLIRKFLECTFYASLDVHTEITLEDFEGTLLDFHERLQEYIEISKDDDNPKNWDGVIKAHTHVHSPRDIRQKGVNRNSDTKPNEKVNGPMRKFYLLQSNFKEIEKQLGALEDRTYFSESIRATIDAWDEYARDNKEEKAKFNPDYRFGKIYLGSQTHSSIRAVINHSDNQGNLAFKELHRRTSECITGLIPSQSEDQVPTTTVQIGLDHPITVCTSIKVDYESMETWRQETDYLHCSAKFHGKARYDSVIVNMDEKPTFCQLFLAFICIVDEVKYPLILVKPLDAAVGAERLVERDLGLCRLRERTSHTRRLPKFVVIPARSIIRGALVIEDTERSGEYLAMDTLDCDMFLRLIDLFPNRNMAAQRRIHNIPS